MFSYCIDTIDNSEYSLSFELYPKHPPHMYDPSLIVKNPIICQPWDCHCFINPDI